MITKLRSIAGYRPGSASASVWDSVKSARAGGHGVQGGIHSDFGKPVRMGSASHQPVRLSDAFELKDLLSKVGEN